MLKHIEIRNYALIEHFDIDFDGGLSVITGETGAGKSIMMGALALVLGQRADTKVIQQGKSKCVVEAVFDIAALALQPLFERLDVDYADECILRREVLDSGKSRAFVNDTPVNLQQLRDISVRLVDIHSQHENLLLGENAFQLGVVDAMAESQRELADYRHKYKLYKEAERRLTDLQQTAEQWRSERDYAQFQFDQLAALALTDGEQDSLEAELEAMNHSEEVKTALAAALENLSDEAVGVQIRLKDTLSALRRIMRFLPPNADYEQRVESALVDLNDIASELENRLNDTDFDPQRKEFVESRLDQIYTLQQKHRVRTVAELLHLQADFEAKLSRIDGFDFELEQLTQQKTQAQADLSRAAEVLSHKRASVQTLLESEVSRQLVQLGMPNANFVVRITTADGFLPMGTDVVEFLFSANKNHAPQTIAQTASGGELSRLMLVIKALMASRTQLPTIVFDEIDTGVSGEVAYRMGLIMSKMAQSMQVIAITHLPQIAAKGTAHYRVFKHDTADATVTDIVRLSPTERIHEIAEMLSGKNPSEAAIENAKELLEKVSSEQLVVRS